ncbi:NUDIX hydrolase [Sulfurimonas sp. SAG-AH-194-L11]|nr:NUDIX hydrolase [Sulfurimonas sp. SAG-AH-194-L11]MDF1876594.1 NUDIX hydrolase [Sulfurimonas sp. SAG-AH-194-L11]
MAKITKISKLLEPNFIKPIAITYEHEGVTKLWEAVISHDAVSILLYNATRDSFVLVKQFRPPVLNANKTDGYTYELCAGIIDKELSDKEIAREEVLEECGYDIPLESITKITSYYTSVGISGALQTLYYAEIDDRMIVNEGGGLEEENIEVIYLPLKEAKAFIFDESFQKTPGLIMAFYWFFDTKKK